MSLNCDARVGLVIYSLEASIWIFIYGLDWSPAAMSLFYASLGDLILSGAVFCRGDVTFRRGDAADCR